MGHDKATREELDEFKDVIKRNSTARRGSIITCFNPNNHASCVATATCCPQCKAVPYIVCSMCEDIFGEILICGNCQYRGKKASPVSSNDQSSKTESNDIATPEKSKKTVERPLSKREEFLVKFNQHGILCRGENSSSHTKERVLGTNILVTSNRRKTKICEERFECPFCMEKEELLICKYCRDEILKEYVCGNCKYNALSKAETKEPANFCVEFARAVCVLFAVLILAPAVFKAHNFLIRQAFEISASGGEPPRRESFVKVSEGIWRKDLRDTTEFTFLMENEKCMSLCKDASILHYVKDGNPCEVSMPAIMANRAEALIKKAVSLACNENSIMDACDIGRKESQDAPGFLGNIEKSYNPRGDTHRHYRVSEKVDKISSLKLIAELTNTVDDVEVVDVRYFRVLKSKETDVDIFLKKKKFNVMTSYS